MSAAAINLDDGVLIGPDYVLAPSGLILPEYVAEARYVPSVFTGISLFAGVGGMDLGFKQAGCHVVAAVEWDADAALTYMCNLCRYGEFTIHFVEPEDAERLERAIVKGMKSREKRRKKGRQIESVFTAGSGWIADEPRSVRGTDHFFFGDVCKLDGARILKTIGMKAGEVGCVFGGPPCQGFSVANKNRSPDDARNELVFEFARLVNEIAPKTVCMENVPGILNMVTPEGLPVVDTFAAMLDDYGGVKAFRKQLKQRPGDVGMVRHRKSEKEKNKPPKKPKKKRKVAQRAARGLFEQEAA